MAKRPSKKVVDAARAFKTALNGNPAIREALIKRIVKAADNVPVITLHQIVTLMEMHNDT